MDEIMYLGAGTSMDNIDDWEFASSGKIVIPELYPDRWDPSKMIKVSAEDLFRGEMIEHLDQVRGGHNGWVYVLYMLLVNTHISLDLHVDILDRTNFSPSFKISSFPKVFSQREPGGDIKLCEFMKKYYTGDAIRSDMICHRKYTSIHGGWWHIIMTKFTVHTAVERARRSGECSCSLLEYYLFCICESPE